MTIGVIGLGYVGLPLTVAFAQAGERVIALDIDPQKVAAVAAGDSYIEDVSSAELREVLPSIKATTRYADLAQAEAVLICVPTPLTSNREPDLGPLNSAARALAQVLQPGQLVVLESTTFPGTTRERLVPLLEESGLRLGDDLNVAFSPERVDPGHGRDDRGVRRSRGGGLPADLRQHRARLDAGGGGAHEAAREHLPLGQYRARERDGDPR
jgi:UDP-N-acetyl-D-glucosamine dehydrogenase